MDSSNKKYKFHQGTELPEKTGVYICMTEEIEDDKPKIFWRACFFDNGNVHYNSKPRWMTYDCRMFRGKVINWFDLDIRDNEYHEEYEKAISANDSTSVLSTFGRFVFPYAGAPTVDNMIAKSEVYKKYSKLYWMITRVKIRTKSLRSNPFKLIKNYKFVNTILRALNATKSKIQDDESFDAEFIINDDFKTVDEHVDYHKKTIMKINQIVNEKIYNLGY